MHITKRKRNDLNEAALISLKKALNELSSTKKSFTEEALRYLVMTEISKKKHWGTFPNPVSSKHKLVFEYSYKRENTKNYKPDIVSYEELQTKKKYNLVVELKIKNSIVDIIKCKEYLNNQSGEITFKIAMVIFANEKGKPFESKLKKLKSNAKRKGINSENSQLLIGFIDWKPNPEKKNEYKGEPKLLWL